MALSDDGPLIGLWWWLAIWGLGLEQGRVSDAPCVVRPAEACRSRKGSVAWFLYLHSDPVQLITTLCNCSRTCAQH